MSWAQVNSPYSMFGIGRLSDQGFAVSRSMGGLSVPWRSHENINLVNPASYSAFYGLNEDTSRTNRDSIFKVTSFEVGVLADAINARNITERSASGNASLAYLALGFPLVKVGGVSAGLVPYSSVNYHLVTEEESDTTIGRRSFIHVGEGSLYKTYVGGAVKKGAVSLGLNGYYLFGLLDQSQVMWLPDQLNSFGTRHRVERSVSGLGWDAGMQLELPLKSSDIVLGLTFSKPISIPVSIDTVVDRVVVISDESFAFLDSIRGSFGSKGTLRLPLSVGIGAAYRSPKLMAGFDFIWQQWSATEGLLTGSLNDSWKVAIGLEYKPDDFRTGRFLERNRYRLGMHFGNHYLQLDDNAVSDFGIAFGLGIPFRQRSEYGGIRPSPLPSTIDLGLDIGRSGDVARNLVAENYIRFTIGLNLNNNYWIFKTRID